LLLVQSVQVDDGLLNVLVDETNKVLQLFRYGFVYGDEVAVQLVQLPNKLVSEIKASLRVQVVAHG
jgi:hypothetical protein